MKRIKKDYYNIYRIILKLKKISNIKVIDYKKSAEDIIALSDLIISMPFTSMTAQGIYNYVPSIYLDLHEQFPHNLYKKNNIYFNNGSKASRAIKKIIYNNTKKNFKILKNLRKKIFNIDFNNTKKIPYYINL